MDKLEEKRLYLATLKKARDSILNGAQSYTMRDGESERTVHNGDLGRILAEIRQVEREIAVLENRLNPSKSSAFRIGVHW